MHGMLDCYAVHVTWVEHAYCKLPQYHISIVPLWYICRACKLGGDRALLLRRQVPALLPRRRAAKKGFNVMDVTKDLLEIPILKVT